MGKNENNTPKTEAVKEETAPVNIETTTIEEAKDVPVTDTKSLIIKCAALVLGAALVVYSFSSCLGKLTEANKSITENLGKPAAAETGSDAPANDIFGDEFADEGTSDDGTVADDTDISADEGTPSDSGSSSASDTGSKPSSTGSSTGSSSSDKKNTAAKKPSTKEEVIAYYNTVINKVKPNAKSITQTKETNYQAGGIDLGAMGAFESIVNKLITSNMGDNKEKCGLTATSAADKNKIFPVENESWASKLTPADVKEAKCSEKDGIYTIGIKILDDDLSATTNHGEGHNGKAISIVQTQSIYDNAGAAASLLKGLKIGYKNGTILAKVDAKTGNVLSVTYDFTWILHVDTLGGVNAPFGITQIFDVKW